MKSSYKPLAALGVAALAITLLVAADKPAPTTAVPAATPAPPAKDGVADPEAVLEVKPSTGALPDGFQPSETLREIVKMAQAGVSEEVLLTYIRGAGKAFHPSPEDIIFLNDLGVGETVLKALIDSRDGSATAGAAPKPATTSPASVILSPNTPVTAAPAINGAVAQPAADAPPAPAAESTTVVVTEPAPVTSVHYFYDSLSPYGSWVNLAGYGWCWQPTVAVVNAGWQPYCDNGRWVYSNFGWYWHSTYSWGWAPFHYGRWHHHARGWLWQPDIVWGASWVSWRYSSQYCGWAPLPPAAYYRPGFGFSYSNGGVSVGINFDFGLSYSHYNYVPVGRFCDPSPRRYLARHDDVRAIHNQTTVINNYVVGNNNTVINRGIDRDRVARGGRTPIPEVTVRDAIVRTSAPGATTRIQREGDREVVYRPVLERPSVGGFERDARRGRDVRSPSSSVAAGGTAPATPAAPTVNNPSSTTSSANPSGRSGPGNGKAGDGKGRGPGSRDGAPVAAAGGVTTPPPGRTPPTASTPNPTAGTPAPAAPTSRPVTAAPKASETLSRGNSRNERLDQLVEEARRKTAARNQGAGGNPSPTTPERAPSPRLIPGQSAGTPAPVATSPAPAPAPRTSPVPTPSGRVSNERITELTRELQRRPERAPASNPNAAASIPARPAVTPPSQPAPVQRQSPIVRSQPAPYTPPSVQREQPGYRPSRELPAAAERSRPSTPSGGPARSEPAPRPAPAPDPAPSVRSSPPPSSGGDRSVEPRSSVQRGNAGGRGRDGDR